MKFRTNFTDKQLDEIKEYLPDILSSMGDLKASLPPDVRYDCESLLNYYPRKMALILAIGFVNGWEAHKEKIGYSDDWVALWKKERDNGDDPIPQNEEDILKRARDWLRK